MRVITDIRPQNPLYPRGESNGYIVIEDKNHPWYGNPRSEPIIDDIEVYGGVTKSEEITKGLVDVYPELTYDDVGSWIIGFDTAHCDDNIHVWPDWKVRKHAEEYLLKPALEACKVVFDEDKHIGAKGFNASMKRLVEINELNSILKSEFPRYKGWRVKAFLDHKTSEKAMIYITECPFKLEYFTKSIIARKLILRGRFEIFDVLNRFFDVFDCDGVPALDRVFTRIGELLIEYSDDRVHIWQDGYIAENCERVIIRTHPFYIDYEDPEEE